MSDFAPTTEQQDALDRFATGRSLKIEAGAGTGKTATLKLLAEATPKRGQYVAFNKAIVVEAGEKMPATVTCNTAHSLAYRAVGKQFSNRLRGGGSKRMKSVEIASRLGIRELRVVVPAEPGGEPIEKTLSASFLAGLAMNAVTRFCQSADEEVGEQHVRYVPGLDFPPNTMANNRLVRRHILPAMRKIWADAIDPRGSLPYRHDYYLKLWQLSSPRIASDFILFDEAQDANPVMVAIVAAQRHAQLVWVGDSQQQIYSFTGAINALDAVAADERTFLSQSFRFGPAVAEVANRILDALDAELRLSGYEKIDSTVGEIDDPDAILCRTNAEAVRQLVGALRDGKRPHLVGGGKEIESFAQGARDLMARGRTDHPDLACFVSWAEVLRYVEEDEQGSDLRLMTKLVTEFGVEPILEALARMPREADADVVISTAHKAKGRQWNRVKLAGDFPEDAKMQGEELRLLYVAVTRAQLRLDISMVGYLTGRGNAEEPTVEEEDETSDPRELQETIEARLDEIAREVEELEDERRWLEEARATLLSMDEIELPVLVPAGNPVHEALAQLSYRLGTRAAAEARVDEIDRGIVTITEDGGGENLRQALRAERLLIVALLDPEKQAHYEEIA